MPRRSLLMGRRPAGGSNPALVYSLIEAADREIAAAMAQGCPILTSWGSVEVCETADPAAGAR